MSRSFSKALAGFADTGSCASSRLAFRNSSGSSTMRRRSDGAALFHAAYNSPTCLVVSFSFAAAAPSNSQSLDLARAIGSRYFIAACEETVPARTRSCTDSGSSLTKPRRRDIQLVLREKRFARSSALIPPACSARSSHACSIAVSASSARWA